MPEGQYSGGSGYVDNRFGWAGYLWDPVLEVYHVRHRVYDPADGRWLQPDPIGHAGGWNLYEYGGGDYANTIDPWGLTPDDNLARWTEEPSLPQPRQPTEAEPWAQSIARVAASLAERNRDQFDRGLIDRETIDRRLHIGINGTRAAINVVLTDQARIDAYSAAMTSAIVGTAADVLLVTGGGHIAKAVIDAVKRRMALAAAQRTVAETTAAAPALVAPGACTGAGARSISLHVRNASFTPDAGSVLQNLTTWANQTLTQNPSLSKTFLRPAELAASHSSRIGPMVYGNAVERIVAAEVRRDAMLSSILRPVGGRLAPDFIGLGPAAGRVFDVTTTRHWPAHLLRPYGPALEPALYARPAWFTGFPR